jgi:hypothetical protein
VTRPVPKLRLASASRAGDAGYLAAADLAALAGSLGVDYRLIGGNAVTLLVAVHGVDELVPERETSDADFASSPRVVADERLPTALLALGYVQERGNRFVRPHLDGAGQLDLAVDVLAPSLVGRLQTNQQYGALFVDEVPGLALALARPAQAVHLQVRLTTGLMLDAELLLPDVTSALVLKAYAYAGRLERRDAVDLWRLLEAAAASGESRDSWPASVSARDASRILHQHFGRLTGSGLKDATPERAKQARIRALVQEVVAPS